MDLLSAYQPALVVEVCLSFERVIAWCLIKDIFRVGPNLVDNQYGFSQGHFIVNTIMHVRALAEDVVAMQ